MRLRILADGTFLCFQMQTRNSQLDRRFDSVIISIMDEHGKRGASEEYRLEDLLRKVRNGDHEPIPLYLDGTKRTSRWSRPLTDEDKDSIVFRSVCILQGLKARTPDHGESL